MNVLNMTDSSHFHKSMQCCTYLSSGPQVAMNVYELSSAAGLPCEIDPALVVALSSQKSGKKFQIKNCVRIEGEKKPRNNALRHRSFRCWEETSVS